MNICVHAWVTGKVQGVYFRDHTHRRAQSLGLTGWVKNLADGRVETVVYGPRAEVMDFVDWLWQGSPASQVSEVCWEEISQQTETDTDFTIL